MMYTPIVINKLSWRDAFDQAIESARLYGRRARVYKHDTWGWTYGCVVPRGDDA